MIARLEGRVLAIDEGVGTIDVNGVGYEVELGSNLAGRLPPGAPVVLWIHTQVREDGISLFGFEKSKEKAIFRQLMAVSGVGPRLAQTLVDGLGVPRLIQAIEQDDLRTLCSVPGIGRKIGQRLTLELKGKLAPEFSAPGAAALSAEPEVTPGDPLPLALARLGYRKSEIDRALMGISAVGLKDASLQERLSAALRILSGASS